jgi:hypothetical protein
MKKISVYPLALIIALLCIPIVTSAESILWSGTSPDLCITTRKRCSGYRLSGVMHQVSYNVRVTNADTGVAIPTGSTVPSETRVKYEFIPHVSSDVYWFGSGGGQDSPNGDWVNGAGSAGELCISKNFVRIIGKDRNRPAYANFTVNPPSKTISGIPSNCTTASDGVSKICTLEGPANVTANFNFGQTYGRFYGQFTSGQSSCGSGDPMTPGAGSPSSDNDVDVPQQTIAHQLTVEEPPGDPPTQPSLTSGTCAINQPHTITMVATDPDGDDIRYGIDWDANGSVDQFMPPTGYVPSGTQQQASRTYATTGAKQVKVFAVDIKGRASPSASIIFNCGQGGDTVLPPNTCPLGYSLQNETCVFAGCPAGYTHQAGECRIQEAQCRQSNFCVGDNLFQRTAQCAESLVRRCVFGCANNNCNVAAANSGNIIAVPALVRSGEPSQISWDTSDLENCTVAGNGDSWSGPRGTEMSGEIHEKVTYVLQCEKADDSAFTDSVTVNILPIFQEN